MGRPSKLTPERQDRIVEAIKAGSHLDVAAEFGGVDRSTFFRWMQKGEAAKTGIYRDFFDAVTTAVNETEVWLAGIVMSAAKKDWRAAMELLKRRHPERWANALRVTGADGGPIRFEPGEVETLVAHALKDPEAARALDRAAKEAHRAAVAAGENVVPMRKGSRNGKRESNGTIEEAGDGGG